MIETIVPIGYLHLINVLIVSIFMFIMVFLDIKKHSHVYYDRVIFYTFIFSLISSALVYSYQMSVPIACILITGFAVIAVILFALYYIVKFMEKCAKLLILKLKNKEEDKKDGN